jgi:molybdenum cofactor synthesis domain-containing protein
MRIGVLTISDRASAGEMVDEGGPTIEDVLHSAGMEAVERAIVSDDQVAVAAALRRMADDLRLDVVLTTGGTGLGPRDLAPEATLAVGERTVPGIADAIRSASLEKTRMAMLSRGVAVIRGETLIINLPGSPKGAREGTEVVLPVLAHAVATLHGARH